jgi:hypothetical protein
MICIAAFLMAAPLGMYAGLEIVKTIPRVVPAEAPAAQPEANKKPMFLVGEKDRQVEPTALRPNPAPVPTQQAYQWIASDPEFWTIENDPPLQTVTFRAASIDGSQWAMTVSMDHRLNKATITAKKITGD